jgi:hypothetical protein
VLTASDGSERMESKSKAVRKHCCDIVFLLWIAEPH